MSLSAVIADVAAEAELTDEMGACLDTFAEEGVAIACLGSPEESLRDAFYGLSSPAGDTWVLSDLPERIEAARRLGLRTCLIGGGGTVAADITLHGWAEATPALLDDFAEDGEVPAGSARCAVLVVCGSPEPSSAGLVAALAEETDYVIACDAGASVCRAAGVVPDAFVGDGDSAGDDVLGWVRTVSARCITFPPAKYATDLALAIDAARHEATRRKARLELVLTCAAGGRPDHAIAVIGQLLKAADAAPRMIEDGFELRVLSPDGEPFWRLGKAALNHTFSAVPLLPATVVSEQGMQWELDHRELPALGDEGISNVITTANAKVTCHAGAIAAYLLA